MKPYLSMKKPAKDPLWTRRCRCGHNPEIAPLFVLMDPWKIMGYVAACKDCKFHISPMETRELAAKEWNRCASKLSGQWHRIEFGRP